MQPEDTVDRPGATAMGALIDRVIAVSRASRAAVLMCVAEQTELCARLRAQAGNLRVLAASPAPEELRDLERQGVETLLLPIRFTSRFKQAQYAVAMARRCGQVSPNERLLCTVASSVAEGDFILIMDVGHETPALALHELMKLTEGIRAEVLDAALSVAGEIARAARRGKRLGAILMLGDSSRVLEGSRQLVPNPFENLAPPDRSLLSGTIRELMVELAKLDGAFVVRGDGLIQTAGAFLTADAAQARVPRGLGARHLAAAAVTACTHATAVVVSATDGHVRVFSQGELVLQMDAESM